MKKFLLFSFIFCSLTASAQRNIYVNKSWIAKTIDSVGEYVASAIGPNYKLVSRGIRNGNDHPGASFLFKDGSDNTAVAVSLQQGLIRHMKDGNADTVIEELRVTGYYAAVFKIYQKAYTPSASIDLVKQNGHAEPVATTEGTGKIRMGFYKGGYADSWILWIRKSSY